MDGHNHQKRGARIQFDATVNNEEKEKSKNEGEKRSYHKNYVKR